MILPGQAGTSLNDISLAHTNLDLTEKFDVKVAGNVEPLSFNEVVEARQNVLIQKNNINEQMKGLDTNSKEYIDLSVEYNRLKHQQTLYSEASGEITSKAWAKANLTNEESFSTKSPGSNAKNGIFDQVYRYDDADGNSRVMIVEAKGGENYKLGSRYNDAEGDRFQQGHKLYQESIITDMRANYNNKLEDNLYNSDPVYRQEVDDLGNLLNLFNDHRDSIDYSVVYQGFEKGSGVATNTIKVISYDQNINGG